MMKFLQYASQYNGLAEISVETVKKAINASVQLLINLLFMKHILFETGQTVFGFTLRMMIGPYLLVQPI